MALSSFKLYIQHWATALKEIMVGSCFTLNMMPCTQIQGHKTVKNVDPCLTWYITRPTVVDPLSWYSTTSSLCTIRPPGPWARIEVKHSWDVPPTLHSEIPSLVSTCSLRSDSPNHRLIRKFKYLNMNDVAEDGLLEALSEVVAPGCQISWQDDACVHGRSMTATSHDAWGTLQGEVPYDTLGPKLVPMERQEAVEIALDGLMEISPWTTTAPIQCNEIIENFTQSERCLTRWPRRWMIFPDKLQDEDPDDPI